MISPFAGRLRIVARRFGVVNGTAHGAGSVHRVMRAGHLAHHTRGRAVWRRWRDPSPRCRPSGVPDDLFDQVGHLLRSRPGWRYEPSTTPGAEPSWCLDPGGEVTLSVCILDGKICVFRPDIDRELYLASLEALSAWIEANEARYL